MRRFFTPLLAAAAFAQTADHPTGPRITPPTVTSVSPQGAQRGTTVEMTVEGLNLAKASAVYFTEKGVKGRIVRVKELPDLSDVRLGSNGTRSTVDLGPLPPRNQVTVEVDIDPEAHVGPVKFRLLTPLGTSPEGTMLVEPYFGESPDREPNDTIDGAFESYLPTVLAGAITRAGDVDLFKIQAKAGEELVFENQAPAIGSTLQPVIRILAANQDVVREVGYDREDAASRFTHRFDKTGTYYVRVTDYESSGRASNTYRILVGKLPVAISAFPLGLRRGSATEIALEGTNIGASRIKVEGKATYEGDDAVIVRASTPDGPAYNELRLALGDDPEITVAPKASRAVTLPVTVNGRIAPATNGVPAEDVFRFTATKGQRVAIEVNARRLGSELDSHVEVTDAAGKPIERAVARAVWETSTVLRDHDSASRGLRIQAWNVLNVGDYVMVGNEILRVEEVPDGPDEDMAVESFGGQRRGMFGTTPEAHGIDRPLYKVQMHPAGAKFSPNGLPLTRIHYRNDDGGPGYGKDSFLDFTAPASGEYQVRLRDVRGLGGDRFVYRLSIREPRPDFRLSVAPRNPNVPAGGTIPLTVTAMRAEGFDGPVEVTVTGLPAGLKATKGVIGAGLDNCTILLSADASAKLTDAAPFQVMGRANAGGRELARRANPGDAAMQVAVGPKPDITMAAVTKVVELEPGQTKDVTVRIARHNGFAGRVPVEVRDLPARVRVTDSGLNGVLLNEDESERSFKLWALPNAAPTEGYIYVSGRVETRSPQQNSHAAPEAILVRVKAAKQVASRD